MRLKNSLPAAGGKISVSRPRLFRWTAVALFSFLSWFAVSSGAQETAPTEYQLKAAFVYNFVKFVDWPTQAFTDASSPYVIGVLGDNVFHDDLKQTIQGKIIKNRSLEFRTFRSVTEVTNCQVLFISASEQSRFPQILDALRGKNILTVSESAPDEGGRFIDVGGMINFVIIDRKIRFQINNSSAKKEGLTISSDLLNLALSVK